MKLKLHVIIIILYNIWMKIQIFKSAARRVWKALERLQNKYGEGTKLILSMSVGNGLTPGNPSTVLVLSPWGVWFIKYHHGGPRAFTPTLTATSLLWISRPVFKIFLCMVKLGRLDVEWWWRGHPGQLPRSGDFDNRKNRTHIMVDPIGTVNVPPKQRINWTWPL